MGLKKDKRWDSVSYFFSVTPPLLRRSGYAKAMRGYFTIYSPYSPGRHRGYSLQPLGAVWKTDRRTTNEKRPRRGRKTVAAVTPAVNEASPQEPNPGGVEEGGRSKSRTVEGRKVKEWEEWEENDEGIKG